MSAVAEKTTKHIATAPKQAGTTFFRKAGGQSFFGTNENPSFFGKPVQPKLTVSTPDDPQEKEADAVADKVMRMPDTMPAAQATPATPPLPLAKETGPAEEKIERREEEEIHTKTEPVAINKINCKEDPEEKLQAKAAMGASSNSPGHSLQVDRNAQEAPQTASEETGITIARLAGTDSAGRAPPAAVNHFHENLANSKGSGSELPGSTRNFMEQRFNADFGKVRIHTNDRSETMNRQVQAQAFTHGNDIYFNKGKYAPDSAGGRLLLAHELTHTIQQGSSPAKDTVTRKIFTGPATVAIHRAAATAPARGSPAIDISDKSGGSTLDDDAKKYFQKSFKTDVGDIRIHTDEEAISICRSRNLPAFTQGKHICLDPGRVSPTSDEGGILLAKQVSESLKQRSISAPGLAGRLDSINKPKATGGAKHAPATGTAAKDKKKTDAKDKNAKKGGKKEDAKGKGKKKKNADGPAVKSVKPNPKRSPRSPDEDPGFQQVVGKTKSTAQKQRDHVPAESKASDAQKAAPAAPHEAESKAMERKTTGVDQAGKEDKPFDAEGFKAELRKKIEDVTPKNLEDASDFKENNKVGEVKEVMTNQVAGEKEQSTGPVTKATAQPLQVNAADNKHPIPMPPTLKGAKPANIGAQNAAPKPKLDNEISLQEQSKSLDDEMKANNVTEDQLSKSNEPSFTAALDQKRGAQKDAAERPKQYRKDEKLMLNEAKAGNQVEASKALAGMDASRGKNFAMVVQQQQTTKAKDHLTRSDVSAAIEAKYAATQLQVTKLLDEADKESNRLFDEGSEAARVQFENYVDGKMSAYKRERYSGFWGGLSWLEDKLFGMPDEVNAFYTQGRQLYLDAMDQVITRVANCVTAKLNAAKQAIRTGKKDIDDYVAKLPKNLAEVGKQAASDIQDKFDSLEQTVNDKKDQLVEGLAKKYVDNLKKVDDRIEEMKEANAGLIDKAIGFLKKVWKVIKDLVNLFTSILSKLASIIGVILDSPSGFFDNLGKAFKQGFNNFKDKFLDYLEQGLMDWLATNLGVAGIELPKEFSVTAIFTLVLQVLGLTKQHIKERAIAILGERKVKLLEGAGGLLYRIYNEGLGVLWDMIKEKLTDLKEIIWEAIKSFIKTKIIEAAIVFMLSLLNPIGAFIKVCMAIYDFLMMLVRFKDRIMELLDSILKAVTDVASGAIDGAANAIEKAFAKSIPVIIGFLAALLHLNDIAAKVRDIITRIRARVDKAIDFVITKADEWIGKYVEKALAVQDKGMAMVEKGKQAVIGLGKKAVGSVLNWAKGLLGLQQTFTTADNIKHRIFFIERGNGAEMMLNPSPQGDYVEKIKEINVKGVPDANVKSDIQVPLKKKGADVGLVSVSAGTVSMAALQRAAIKVGEHLNGLIDSGMRTSTDSATEIKDQTPDFSASLLGLSMITSYLLSSETGGGVLPVTPVPSYGGLNNGFATRMEVKPLTKLGAPGTAPSAESPVMRDLLLRKSTPSGRAFYVRGHLLNNNVHGSGDTWANLAPLAQTTNTQYEAAIEDKIKEAVFDKGLILHFTVQAKYPMTRKGNLLAEIEDKAGWNTNSELSEKHRIIEAESKLPTHLICTSRQIRVDGSELPADDPAFNPRYNFTDIEIDNQKNVHQDSLNNYYLEDATAVTLKTFSQVDVESANAIKTDPGLTWDAFRNSPANKLSIDGFSNSQRESIRKKFQIREIIADEDSRISHLTVMQSWRTFTGNRVAYGKDGPLEIATQLDLQQKFRSRMILLKGFLFQTLTYYVQNRLDDPDTQWGVFKNRQQLYPKQVELASGAEDIITEEDIQNFKTNVFDVRIKQLKQLAAAPATTS